MVIELAENIVSNYNERDQRLFFISLDNHNDSVYIVEGWFGKKLSEFLEGSRELEQFLQRDDLGGDTAEVFKRLLVTLMDQGVLSCAKASSVASVKPFLEEEYQDFGTENLKGSFVIEALKIEDTVAYSHGGHINYTDGGEGGDVVLGNHSVH